MGFTPAHRLPAGMAVWLVQRGKVMHTGLGPNELEGERMGCSRCGGITAAELIAAMEQLVCDETAITGSYCHCHDIDGSMWTCLLPEDKNPMAEPSNDRGRWERERS